MDVALNAYISSLRIDGTPAVVPSTDTGSNRQATASGVNNRQTENSYQIRISPEGKNLSSTGEQSSPEALSDTQSQSSSSTESSDSRTSPEFSEEELRELQELQKRDTEVRSHEQAHLAAAGQYAAGGPQFTYQTGPNGKQYAIGGEVPIDIGKEQTPEQTLAKMQIISRAALAPLNPSSADRRIAARAATLSAQARREIQLEDAKAPGKQQGEASTSSSTAPVEQDSPETSAAQPSQDQDSGVASNSRHMVLRAYQAQSV